VEKVTPDLTPQPPSLLGKGEKSKPLSSWGRGLENRVVLYNQRKNTNVFQSLSPRGGEVWRGVKISAKTQEIMTYEFFFFPMKPLWCERCGEGFSSP